jgi:hypothetical protein
MKSLHVLVNRRKRCPLLVVSTVIELHCEEIGEYIEIQLQLTNTRNI